MATIIRESDERAEGKRCGAADAFDDAHYNGWKDTVRDEVQDGATMRAFIASIPQRIEEVRAAREAEAVENIEHAIANGRDPELEFHAENNRAYCAVLATELVTLARKERRRNVTARRADREASKRCYYCNGPIPLRDAGVCPDCRETA